MYSHAKWLKDLEKKKKKNTPQNPYDKADVTFNHTGYIHIQYWHWNIFFCL